ncbi:MAG: GNAT family N-acetyltransferase [Nitrososphaerota archaeon]|nr:GNAT family N-acetyltransferase [Nitrososphaerota archaeon]MDG7024909.1 GNAT family N-acetyltransferase [Nitrososphaerota archaeon]
MLQGKLVYPRGIEREDLSILHQLENDEEVMGWARFRPDHTRSREELERRYEDELRGNSPTRRTFAIVYRRTAKVAGCCSIRWWRPFATSAEIGLALAKDSRGKGIGTEVTGLLTELAFDQYNMHRVELFTRADNKGMIRSAEKNGLKVEGRMREALYFDGRFHDDVQMAILREEFRKSA